MVRPVTVVIGAVVALVLGSGIATALVRSDDNGTAAPAPAQTTSTTVEATTTTAAAVPTTSTPRTTLARVTTTRRPAATTTAPAPAPVPAPTVAPVTTRPALTRAAATQALCRELETSVRQVVGGNVVAGGLRLLTALGTYGDVADPSVVTPARRAADAGASGDLETSAVAVEQAAGACRALGYTVTLPGPIQCVTTPCP